jgi:hypothetical protein
MSEVNDDFLLQAMVAIAGVEKTKEILIYREQLEIEYKRILEEKERGED